MSDNSLVVFKAISNFIKDLDSEFGKKQKSLQLYNHLIEKTTIVHEKPIQKHLQAFREFCEINNEAIVNKDVRLMKESCVCYSDKVFVNLPKIFEICNSETEQIIWQHLLTISALINPSSKAKNVLRQMTEDLPDTDGSPEEEFVEEILTKVKDLDLSEDKDDLTSNPMGVVMKLMNSGALTEIMGIMNNRMKGNKMDMNKVMTLVLGKISGGGENTEMIQQLLSTFGSGNGLDLMSLMSGMN